MKRVLLILVGLVVAGGLIVSGLWFMNQNQVWAETDAGIAQLAEQDVNVTYGERSMAGFPFAYEPSFSDVVISTPDWTLTFPVATGRLDFARPDTIKLLFPPEFTAVRKLGEIERVYNVTATNLTADFTQASATEIAYTATADDMRVEPPEGGVGDFFELSNPQIIGRVVTGGSAQDLDLDPQMTADAFESQFAMAGETGDTADATLSGTELDLKLDFSERLISFDASAATAVLSQVDESALFDVSNARGVLIVTPQERLDLTMLTDPTHGADVFERLESLIETTLDEGGSYEVGADLGGYALTLDGADVGAPYEQLKITGVDGKLSVPIDQTKGRVALSSGRLDYESVGGATASGAVETLSLEADYPVRQGEPGQIQDGALRLEIADVTLDEGTWAILDPQSSATREIQGVRLDTAFGVELFADLFGDQALTAGPPQRFQSFDLKALEMSFLGFEATASGEISGLDQLPAGRIDVILDNWDVLQETFLQNGLLPAPMIGIAGQLLDQLGQPGGTPTEQVYKIELRDGDAFVNDVSLADIGLAQ